LSKDMYRFSQRKRDIHLCLLYAVRVAARGGGWMKAHVHDRDCNHLQACKECKFNVAHENERSIWKFCGIGILMRRGLTFTEAYQVVRDLRRPAP
jgi:hypothetical protein